MSDKGLSVEMPAGYPELVTTDKKIINEFIVRVPFSSIMIHSINFAKEQHREAVQLIGFLEQEYDLK